MPRDQFKRSRRGRATASPDLERFRPVAPIARLKVDELVQRGAIVVAVRSSLVTLRRQAQTARVDAWGRVDWAS